MGKGTLRTIAGAATMMDLYEGHDVDDDDRVKRGEEAGRFLLDSCYEDIAFARYLVRKVKYEAQH